MVSCASQRHDEQGDWRISSPGGPPKSRLASATSGRPFLANRRDDIVEGLCGAGVVKGDKSLQILEQTVSSSIRWPTKADVNACRVQRGAASLLFRVLDLRRMTSLSFPFGQMVPGWMQTQAMAVAAEGALPYTDRTREKE